MSEPLGDGGLLLDSHGCIQTDLSGALWSAAASASCTPGTSCFWPQTCNKLGGEKSPQGRTGREKIEQLLSSCSEAFGQIQTCVASTADNEVDEHCCSGNAIKTNEECVSRRYIHGW